MHRTLLALLIFIPHIVGAAPRTYRELAYMLIDIINALIGVTFVLAIVVYFIGIVTALPSVTKGGATKELGQRIMWGLLALFVMFSIWGILRIVQNTLFSGSGAELTSSRRGAECATFSGCNLGE